MSIGPAEIILLLIVVLPSIPAYIVCERRGVGSPGLAFIPIVGPTIVILQSIETSAWASLWLLLPPLSLVFGIWLAFMVPIRQRRSAFWGFWFVVPVLNLIGFYVYAFTLARRPTTPATANSSQSAPPDSVQADERLLSDGAADQPFLRWWISPRDFAAGMAFLALVVGIVVAIGVVTTPWHRLHHGTTVHARPGTPQALYEKLAKARLPTFLLADPKSNVDVEATPFPPPAVGLVIYAIQPHRSKNVALLTVTVFRTAKAATAALAAKDAPKAKKIVVDTAHGITYETDSNGLLAAATCATEGATSCHLTIVALTDRNVMVTGIATRSGARTGAYSEAELLTLVGLAHVRTLAY